jgi:DNA-binding CsgD family transcriptional regulator
MPISVVRLGVAAIRTATELDTDLVSEAPTFVGRGRELAMLTDRVGAPAGGVLLVAGPAGIGKTTLVEAALRAAGTVPVVRGWCPAEAAPPLWPWRSALRRVGADPSAAPAEHSGLSHVQARFGQARFGAAVPTDGTGLERDAAASARFAALAAASDALLAAGPLIVVLEDLHWADTASLDLLHQVAAGSSSAVTVIGTVRSPTPEDIAVRLAALSRHGATTVTLPPFTPDEVAALVGPAAAAQVFLRTGGLPLLVAAHRDDSGPADVAAVVRTLLAALTPPQRTVLEAAAILGDEIDEDLLAAVVDVGAVDVEIPARAPTGHAGQSGGTGADPGATGIGTAGADPEATGLGTAGADLGATGVAAALTAAWHGGLLATHGGRYRFVHALVRDGIADRLEPSFARRLHRAAAICMEAASGGTDRSAGRIAAHWRLAGGDPTSQRAAAGWSRRAGEQARAAYAYEDAVQYLTEALADLAPLPGGDAERVETTLDLAHVEYLAGRFDRCLHHCRDAAETAATIGRGDLVARAALVLQGVSYLEAEHVLPRLCRQALDYPDLPDALRARLLAQLAVMAAGSGRTSEAMVPARQALALAEACEDPVATIEAARAREVTLVEATDTPERLRLGELVADRAEANGQPLAAVIGHEWRMAAGYRIGRPEIADDAMAGMERIAERSRLPVVRWHVHRARAARAMLVGAFAESVEESRRADVIARESGDTTAYALYYAHGIRLAVVRGAPEALPEGYREAFANAPQIPFVLVEAANALALVGSLDEARDYYARVAAQLPMPTEHPAWMAVLIEATELIRRFEDADAAELAYRQLAPFRPYPGPLGTPTAYFLGCVSRYLGELAATFGDLATAEELLREAVTRDRAMGAGPGVAAASLGLARVLRAGQASRATLAEAATLTRNALDLAVRLDMPGTAAEARRLATEIAAERDRIDPLTTREREIAELLAKALTNRQIAERLVLSERTIESHVRNILVKTGCTNRTEFVARWSADAI